MAHYFSVEIPLDGDTLPLLAVRNPTRNGGGEFYLEKLLRSSLMRWAKEAEKWREKE